MFLFCFYGFPICFFFISRFSFLLCVWFIGCHMSWLSDLCFICFSWFFNVLLFRGARFVFALTFLVFRFVLCLMSWFSDLFCLCVIGVQTCFVLESWF